MPTYREGIQYSIHPLQYLVLTLALQMSLQILSEPLGAENPSLRQSHCSSASFQEKLKQSSHAPLKLRPLKLG